MSSNNLNMLMQKLYVIEKTLGPKGGKAGEKVDSDGFNAIKVTVTETVNVIRKKMDEKEQKITKFGGSNVETLRMGGEIKERIADLEKQLGQMNEVLRKQKREKKRYPVTEVEIKEKQYNNFISQMKDLKARERGGANFNEPTIRTLLDAKSDFMDRPAGERRGPERDLSTDELAALERFKENDEKQNDLIDQINNGLETLTVKSRNIGDQIDNQTQAVEALEVEMEETYQELESSNAKLKKVLVEYRKPGKFCMDVCLLVVLLGLIGVIVKCF